MVQPGAGNGDPALFQAGVRVREHRGGGAARGRVAGRGRAAA